VGDLEWVGVECLVVCYLFALEGWEGVDYWLVIG